MKRQVQGEKLPGLGRYDGEIDARPLAARIRPRSFDEFVGQEHLVGEGRVLRKCIETDRLPSMVLWGPSGSGKTTLAHVIAGATGGHFASLSAVSAGVADLRRVAEEAQQRLKLSGQRTVLFVDEIHRFNKAQQDAVLPFVENGIIILVGATTENPSFEVISPLLSRCRVFCLKPLTEEQVEIIVKRAVADEERGMGRLKVEMEEGVAAALARSARGDARVALNTLEMMVDIAFSGKEDRLLLGMEEVADALERQTLLYDKDGEQHYDFISALHKSLRGSDPDAGLYWLGCMLESGEEPLYIARRLVRFASEDVGMADPQALVIAVAAEQAVHFIGLPEGNLALAEAVVYLATAPKSNSLYRAYSRVQDDIKENGNAPVPLHLRNPVTELMRQEGYGKGYKYAHDYPGGFVNQGYLPTSLKGKRYYVPEDGQGFEKEIARRLKEWWQR